LPLRFWSSQTFEGENLILYVAYFLAAVLLRLICRETGLDCDFVIEGETEEEILSKGADHAIKVHDLKAEDIFFEQTM
jgi:predicted small metal-binding protein